MRGFISSTITGATNEILRLTSPGAGLRSEKQQQVQKDTQGQTIGHEYNEKETDNIKSNKINNRLESAANSGQNTATASRGNIVTPDNIPSARFDSNEMNSNTNMDTIHENSIFKRIGANTKFLVQQSVAGIQSQIQDENSTVRKMGQGAQNLVHKTVSNVQAQMEDENSTVRKIGSSTGLFVRKSVTGVQSGLSAQLENENSTLKVIGKNTESIIRKSVEGVQSGVTGVSVVIQSQLEDENSTLSNVGKQGETLVVELRSQIENKNSITRKLSSSTGELLMKSVAGVSAGVKSQLEEDSAIRKVGSSSYEWASQWIQQNELLNKRDSLEAEIAASTTPQHAGFVQGKYGGYSLAAEEVGVLSTLKTRAKNFMEHVNESLREGKYPENYEACSLELFLSDSIDDGSYKLSQSMKHHVNSNSIYPSLIPFLGFIVIPSKSSNIAMISSDNNESAVQGQVQSIFQNNDSCTSIYPEIFSFLDFSFDPSKAMNEIIHFSKVEGSTCNLPERIIPKDEELRENNVTTNYTLIYSNLIPFLKFVDCNSLYPATISFLGFLVNTNTDSSTYTNGNLHSPSESNLPNWKERATRWIQHVSENEATNQLTRHALSILSHLPEKVNEVLDVVATINQVPLENETRLVVDDTSVLYPNVKQSLGFHTVLPDSKNGALGGSTKPQLSMRTEDDTIIHDSELSSDAFIFKWKRRATNVIRNVNNGKITNEWRQRVLSMLSTKDKDENQEEITSREDILKGDLQSYNPPLSSSPVKEVSYVVYDYDNKSAKNYQSTFPEPPIVNIDCNSVYPEILASLRFNIILGSSESDKEIKFAYPENLSNDYYDLQFDQTGNLQVAAISGVLPDENTNPLYPELVFILGYSYCYSLYPDLITYLGYNPSESSTGSPDCDGFSTSAGSSASAPISQFLSEDKLSLWRRRANDLIKSMHESNNRLATVPHHDEENSPSLVGTVNAVDISIASHDLNAIFNTDDNLTISSGSTFSSTPASSTPHSQPFKITKSLSSRFQALQAELSKLPPAEEASREIVLQRSNSYPDFSEEANAFKSRDSEIGEEDVLSDPLEKFDNISNIKSPSSQQWAPCDGEKLLKRRGRFSVDSKASSTRSITPTRVVARGNATSSTFKRRKRRRPKTSLDSSLDSYGPRRSLEDIMNEDRKKHSLQRSLDSRYQVQKKNTLGRMIEREQYQEDLTLLYQSKIDTEPALELSPIIHQSSNEKSHQQQIQEDQKLLSATTNIILLHLLSLSSTFPNLPLTEMKPDNRTQAMLDQKEFLPSDVKSSFTTQTSLVPHSDTSAITIPTKNIRPLSRPALSRDSSLLMTSTLADLNFSSDEDEDEKKSQDGSRSMTGITTTKAFYSSPVPNMADDSTVITGIRHDHTPNPYQFVSSTKWLQMVALWKHSQMMDAMTALRPISHHYMQDNPRKALTGNASTSTCSSSATPSISFKKRIRSKAKMSISNRMKSFLKSSSKLKHKDSSLHLSFSDTFDNLNGFCLKDAIHHEDLPLLSHYFVKLGSVPNYHLYPKCPTCNSQHGNYRWERRTIKQYIPKANPSIYDYLSQAGAHLSLFSEIIERVISYSSQNSSSPTPHFFPNENRSSYTINIKTQQGIKRKAQRKYNGDISLVKDILRAQVVLPDEGSIVCALLALKKEKDVKIVRLKNLFYCLDLTANTYVESNLPTGYRHVLLNLRFSDGFLCEFQIHLAPMYDVLGEEGYSLHSNLNKIELWKENETSENKTILTEQELGICLECRKSSFSSEGVQKSSQNNGTSKCIAFNSYLQSLVRYYYPSCQSMRSAYNNAYASFASLTMSCHRMIDSLVTIARHDIQAHPRDIARHICLAEIHKAKYMLHERKSDMDHVGDVMKQSLVIADQATASGMIGWLEYGESQPLDRMMERPLYILANLGSHYARMRNWSLAASTFWALLSRCEQHIPLYHPFTITCMLDLAACVYANGEEHCATQVVQRASSRLALYLAEQEKYVQQFHNIMSIQQSWEEDDCEEAKARAKPLQRLNLFLTQLKMYAARLKQYVTRPMMTILGPSHPITLLFHCYIADVLSVLANCLDSIDISVAAELKKEQRIHVLSKKRELQLERNSYPIWKEAGIHYSYAIHRWLHVQNSLCQPNILTACSALARTLREINSPDSAANLLGLIVSSILNEEKKEILPVIKTKSITTLKRSCRRIYPVAVPFGKNLAICLWWLSVYFAECNPDERGRIRALSLLHASTEKLQQSQEFALPSSPCIVMLNIVQQEVKKLSTLAISNNSMVSSHVERESLSQKEFNSKL